MAMKAGDASSSMEILALFDEAIRVNPTSPVLYLNKASFLLQVCSADAFIGPCSVYLSTTYSVHMVLFLELFVCGPFLPYFLKPACVTFFFDAASPPTMLRPSLKQTCFGSLSSLDGGCSGSDRHFIRWLFPQAWLGLRVFSLGICFYKGLLNICKCQRAVYVQTRKNVVPGGLAAVVVGTLP